MNSYKKLAAVLTALCMAAGFTACGGDNSTEAPITEAVTTVGVTVRKNTETLAPEYEEQVADSLTGELENKTIKWMSFYDPWHPTGYGNSKPVSVELFEKKYVGEIEYYTTTWTNQFNDLSTYILGGEGIDFFPAPEAVPKCALDKMTQSYDQYIDWNNPLWQSVKNINDQFMLGDNHYCIPPIWIHQSKQPYTIKSVTDKSGNALFFCSIAKYNSAIFWCCDSFVRNETALYYSSITITIGGVQFSV